MRARSFPLACAVFAATAATAGPATAAPSRDRGELLVFAAASLTDALREIATAYERAGGDRILLNLAASSTLARQIQEGAPADLFLSADEAKMDDLERRGLLLPGTRRSVLSNALVIVVPVDGGLAPFAPADLGGPRVRAIALAEPSTVPAGIYARAYLEAMGLWAQVAPKVVPTENVRAALAAVESGNADAGVVYKTDAGIAKRAKVAWEVPAAEGPEISYPFAVVKGAARPAAARRFLDHLGSPAALDVFRRYGFAVRQR